jgi:hypothetical protein
MKLQVFLTRALDGCEWSDDALVRLKPGKELWEHPTSIPAAPFRAQLNNYTSRQIALFRTSSSIHHGSTNGPSRGPHLASATSHSVQSQSSSF